MSDLETADSEWIEKMHRPSEGMRRVGHVAGVLASLRLDLVDTSQRWMRPPFRV